MFLRKILPFICFIPVLAFISCGGDYTESGIEGRWQLKEIVGPTGKTQKVDTIFFAFKRKVFEYQKLLTPTQYFHCFGNYSHEKDSLYIYIDRESFEPADCDSCFDWDSYVRSFSIKKHNSSYLELESKEGVFFLRKY